ncbi:MAG: hypothetical protein VX237_08480, partial [Chloroflexota bacterium]|nr:hypothetical protein [Chloroflexota bacterium]
MSATYTILENWNENDIRPYHYGTRDGVDEPDESFTVTLSESSAYGEIGSQNSLENSFTDYPTDAPPYVIFTNSSQDVSEAAANTTVTVSLELKQPSGWANPSIPYEVSLSSTATASGDYADHNLAAGILTFDGAVGDQNQDIEFTLLADTYDEGIDTDASAHETIIITLDADNASNLQVDEDGGQGAIIHTVIIKDNDPTPQLTFSTSADVSATSGNENAASAPTINVIVSDGGGTNLTPSALPITLNVTNHTTTPGTATIYNSAAPTTPWDYKINGETGSVTGATIPAYSSTYSIPLEINNDAFYEGTSETVKFDVTAGNNASGGTFTHTYTINETDDDDP